MDHCPHWKTSSKFAEKQLPNCPRMRNGEVLGEIQRKENSSKKQHCPFCNKLCRRVENHLPYCSHQNKRCKSVENRLTYYTPRREIGEENDDRGLSQRLRKAEVDPLQLDVSLRRNIAKIRRVVLETLNNGYGDFSYLRWQIFKSGSYYESVKVDKADEFDLMFTCKVRCEVDFRQQSAKTLGISGMYVALEANENTPKKLIYRQKWISPSVFYKYFHEAVTRSLGTREMRQLSVNSEVRYKRASPAITLDYTNWGKSYSIDLVPAIEIVGFPETSEKVLRDSWLPDECITSLCRKYHVVAKQHSSELVKKPSRSLLWRLSFSAAEKAIISGADDEFSGGHETCRKAVLCLLKTDLLRFYDEPTRQGSPQEFCSYLLKMLMLNLYDQIPSDVNWEKNTMLLPRYVDALRYWEQILVDKHLPHFFIRRVNLLEQIGLVPEANAQLCALHDHVTSLIANYATNSEETAVVPEADAQLCAHHDHVTASVAKNATSVKERERERGWLHDQELFNNALFILLILLVSKIIDIMVR